MIGWINLIKNGLEQISPILMCWPNRNMPYILVILFRWLLDDLKRLRVCWFNVELFLIGLKQIGHVVNLIAKNKVKHVMGLILILRCWTCDDEIEHD